MSKMYLAAKVILTILGVYVLVTVLQLQHLFLAIIEKQLSGFSEFRMLVFIIVMVLPFILAYYLLFRSDNWARKIAGPISETTPAVQYVWLVAAFRMAAMLYGLIVLSSSIEFLVKAGAFIIHGPREIIDMVVFREIHETFIMSISSWVWLFTRLAKIALGAYMLLGAPHFVRWHVRKFSGYSVTKDAGART